MKKWNIEYCMTPNHKSLIDQVELTKELDFRFQDIQCMNISASRRRGVLSLVFQAKDKISNKKVAIKFMDPERLGDKYRIDAFEREPEILEKIEHKKRCLGLVSGLNHFQWNLLIPGGTHSVNIPIQYFAVDWLEDDIDYVFHEQHILNPIEKLKMFRLILLAVEAIHSESVSHRDLKPDNLRATNNNGNQVVIVIDFGTSAVYDAPNLVSTYHQPVGAPAYSSPEAFAGFAGYRELGESADIYALGCLLYELFNKEIFGKARGQNPNFNQALVIMASEMARLSTWEEKLNAWKSKMPLIRNIVEPPPIDGPGNSVPPVLKFLLNKAYGQMVKFDFNDRTLSLEQIRKIIDSAINVLLNEKRQKQILERKKEMRRRRLEKIKLSEERLNTYIKGRTV